VRKEHPKKRTHVQISAGGLEDSDAEAVNPFPSKSSKSRTLTEDELVEGSQRAKRDLSRRNDVNTYLPLVTSRHKFLIWIHPAGFYCHDR